jgi:hypothetical protein
MADLQVPMTFLKIPADFLMKMVFFDRWIFDASENACGFPSKSPRPETHA